MPYNEGGFSGKEAADRFLNQKIPHPEDKYNINAPNGSLINTGDEEIPIVKKGDDLDD